MPTKIGNISEAEIKQVSLPTGFSKQYVTVPHGYIIDTVKNLLSQKNYEINKTEYRCTNGGEVVQGVYYINHGDDPELGLMFAWSNSYDRSQRFKCAVGAHVFVCGNGMLVGDMANYGKVHKGDKSQVLKNVSDHIELQINSASNFYDMIKKDKEAMKNKCLTESEIAELMGVLFFKEDLITSGQLITVKKQYLEPAHDYNAPLNSLWAIYNHITYAFKSSHPKKWMDTLANFHSFISKRYIEDNTVTVNPNQVTLDQLINHSDVIDKEVTPNPLDNLLEEVDTPLLGTDDMNSCPEATEEEANELLHGVDNTGGLEPEFNPVSLRVRDDKIEQFDDETGEIVKNEALDNLANEEADMIKNEEIIEERKKEDVSTLEMFVLQFYNQETEELEDHKCKLIPVDEYDENSPEYKGWRYEDTGMIFNKETVVLINENVNLLESNDKVLINTSEEDVFNAIADKVRPEVSEEIIEKTEAEDILSEAENIEESNNDLSFDNYFEEDAIDEDINLSDINDIETELKNGSQEDFDEKVENESEVENVENVEDIVEEPKEDKLELPEFDF